ncbi:Uncharacterized protein FWK35_00012793 [Aphis craccivora]|uniref:Uncharacterized protein n=1 Tax=Aphis craccivora TaxID=307492 RepID=A0A6G0Y850_APHCR|nr:Uncharacterized protein FWK35_00012793 [Aphis craccivora]
MSHNVHGVLHLTEDSTFMDHQITVAHSFFIIICRHLRVCSVTHINLKSNEGANLNSTSTSEKEPHVHGLLLGSHNKGHLLNGNCKIKSNIDADSYFYTTTKKKKNEILSGYVNLIGLQFKEKENFYLQPIKPSLFEINKAKTKIMIMPCNDELLAVPLLHLLLNESI